MTEWSGRIEEDGSYGARTPSRRDQALCRSCRQRTSRVSGGIHRLMKHLILFGISSVALIGCGSNDNGMPGCTPNGFAMVVRPSDPLAAPDHTAKPPGNQELLVAAVGSEVGPGCASTHLYHPAHAQWTTSDSKIVTISSADDTTNGLATCLAPTSVITVSATLTADGFTETHSSPAPITCK